MNCKTQNPTSCGLWGKTTTTRSFLFKRKRPGVFLQWNDDCVICRRNRISLTAQFSIIQTVNVSPGGLIWQYVTPSPGPNDKLPRSTGNQNSPLYSRPSLKKHKHFVYHLFKHCLWFLALLGKDYMRDRSVWNFLKADIFYCRLKHKQQERWTTFATWHFGKAIPLQNIINLFIVFSVKQPQCALMLLAVQEDQICIYSFIWLTGCISDFLSVLVI